MTIAGKTVLVTGANRGIGRALVAEALSRGATRVYAGTRQPLAHPDGRVTPLALEVTNQAQIQQLSRSSRSSAVDRRPVVTTSHLEPTSMSRRRSRLGLRHRWPATAWGLLPARGQAEYQSRPLGLLERAVAAARSLRMAAATERIRTLQAAQAGGPKPAEAMAAAPELWRTVFRQEGQYWTVVFDGAVVRLRDAKGLRHLARLLAHPGREFHTLDLEAAEAQAAPTAPRGLRASGGEPELVVRRDLGDAGALLDTTAKAAYQTRIQELRAELEEAEGGNDPIRAAKARQELEFLVAELARAVGLGGRDRRAASHAERARLNVTRAIRAAMANLAGANPALGRHLAATVRTGRYCAYTPDPRLPIAWER